MLRVFSLYILDIAETNSHALLLYIFTLQHRKNTNPNSTKMSGIYWKIQHEIVSLIFWPSQLKQKIYLHKPNEMKKYKKNLWKKKYLATALFHIAVYNVVNLFSKTLNSTNYESYILIVQRFDESINESKSLCEKWILFGALII